MWYNKTVNYMKKVKKTKQIKKIETLKLEKSVAQSEAIFASLGDHVTGLVIVDKKGKIVRVNQGFETLTGWGKKEAMGKSLLEIIKREDEKGNEVPFKERILSKVLSGTILTTTATAAIGGIEKIPTFYYVRRNKSRFPATSVISPILLKGKITGAAEIFYDVSKEKELERMRMDFLSFASHQLRTPLSGIKWLVETMQNEVVGEMTKKQKEYLDDIYKINEHMIRLVSNMLNTIRLENEETLIRKEKISVPSVLKDVLFTVAAVAKEKKITLEGPLNSRALTVETDLEVLRSILRCFLYNAIDYSMPSQKVILNIKEEPRTVMFFVRDFGIGIPKSEQKKIFERFHRAANAKNFKPAGTGLGLNIAKSLAEKIGGKILFKSEENKGSTFYLCIPKGRVEIKKLKKS